MKEKILIYQNDPIELEKMYRGNKTIFKRQFNKVYSQIRGNALAEFWYARLNYENEEISWGSNRELIFVVVASVIAGIIAKLPEFMNFDPEYFYPRNIGFVVFPLLTAYFAYKKIQSHKKMIIICLTMGISVIYINLLPDNENSDTLILSCIHLLLVQWSLLGLVFVGPDWKNFPKRLEFLRYNGDLVVMTALLLIAGGLLTGMTLGLFALIDLQIEEFYFEYIAVWGLAASPIAGTFLVITNPPLVNKVSPVIAKVFTPLVLIMLIIYLAAVIYTGKNPYSDREFLIIFNALLIGVMALILFSIAGTSEKSESRMGVFALFGLSVATIIVNTIALSAILFRIYEWGVTPNRLAVLGGNISILINLIIVTFSQFQAIKHKSDMKKVEVHIANFLPVYIVWAMLVTFLFPILFNFE